MSVPIVLTESEVLAIQSQIISDTIKEVNKLNANKWIEDRRYCPDLSMFGWDTYDLEYVDSDQRERLILDCMSCLTVLLKQNKVSCNYYGNGKTVVFVHADYLSKME